MGLTAAVSVAVGVWTLVAISLERYFAICRPLKSRIWQTRSHAYKMIIAIWILSLSLCLPVAVLSRLKPIRETGKPIQLSPLGNSICRQIILN
jgi:cholecystokinin-like receptor